MTPERLAGLLADALDGIVEGNTYFETMAAEGNSFALFVDEKPDNPFIITIERENTAV